MRHILSKQPIDHFIRLQGLCESRTTQTRHVMRGRCRLVCIQTRTSIRDQSKIVPPHVPSHKGYPSAHQFCCRRGHVVCIARVKFSESGRLRGRERGMQNPASKSNSCTYPGTCIHIYPDTSIHAYPHIHLHMHICTQKT